VPIYQAKIYINIYFRTIEQISIIRSSDSLCLPKNNNSIKASYFKIKDQRNSGDHKPAPCSMFVATWSRGRKTYVENHETRS